jgi:small subunit ribosomal protein S16
MLVIRLSRTGRNKYPTYRIVAADSKRASTGRFISVLGNYNPHTKELVIKKDEIEKYLGNGAQPSNSVIKLLKREKVKLPDWAKLKTKEPKPVETEAKADEAPGEKPAETGELSAVNAEENAETIEEHAVSEDLTETAEMEEKQAEATEEAEDAAAEAATDTKAE